MQLQPNSEAQQEAVLHELSLFRICRLRMGKQEVFTLEDMLYQIQQAWGFNKHIPHALNGSIATQAAKRGIIAHSGYGRSTRGARHNGEVRTYSWKL